MRHEKSYLNRGMGKRKLETKFEIISDGEGERGVNSVPLQDFLTLGIVSTPTRMTKTKRQTSHELLPIK